MLCLRGVHRSVYCDVFDLPKQRDGGHLEAQSLKYSTHTVDNV